MRQCKKCKKYKTPDKFTKNKNCSKGIEHTCRKCSSDRKINWEKINRSAYKNAYLKYKFKIDLNKYTEMSKKQNSVCAICKNPETEIFKKSNKLKDLCIDHCHFTGKIRGLLCRKCNTGLGNFRDSPEYLKTAIKYLKKEHK